MKTVFVAGTDTGVGKTMIAGALASALRLGGYRVGVMKPISCGGREDAEFLKQCADCHAPIDIVNPIFLKEPLSPNVAARVEKKRMFLGKILSAKEFIRRRGVDYLIVEGCGGLMVPIQKNFFVIDLIPLLKARAVLVSRSGLGAINHSLLSLEALASRRIRPLGVIFNRLQSGPLTIPEKTNPGIISKIAKIPSLGLFPYMRTCAADCAGKAFLKHIDLEKIL